MVCTERITDAAKFSLAQELVDAEKFVMDIREFTSSVSGSTTPVGIVLFGVS